jgi:hypothetical protein
MQARYPVKPGVRAGVYLTDHGAPLKVSTVPDAWCYFYL